MSEVSSNLKLIEDAITRDDVGTVRQLLSTVKKATKEEDLPSLNKVILNLAYKSMLYESYKVFDFFYKQDKTILTTPINGNRNYLIQNVATIGTFDAFKKTLQYYVNDKINLSDLKNANNSNTLHTIASIDVSLKELPDVAKAARDKINQMATMVLLANASEFFKMCETDNKSNKKPFQICKEETTYSHMINIAKTNPETYVGIEMLKEVKKFDDLQSSLRTKMLQPSFSVPTKLK